VDPTPSATVLLLRDDPLEVLMIRRHERASFVPDAWVFPGGVVDEVDRRVAASRADLDVMRVCAVRELFEETGIWLGGAIRDREAKRELLLAGGLAFPDLWREAPPPVEELVWTARWITPVGIPRRFDTWFFLARAGRDVEATVEHYEAVEATWISPAEALARQHAGGMAMVFPTIRNLEAIARFETTTGLFASRQGIHIETVQPVIVLRDGKKLIVLPDEA
jgi:8-oxo-dGTP pyrophosphatase MutT (NUDIX family)